MSTQTRHGLIDHEGDIERLKTHNAEQLASLESEFKNASTEFLERIAATHMEAADTQRLKSLLELNDYPGFQLKLRNSTMPERSGSVIRCAYWALNDAMSFFADALGTTWRYMDLADRIRYLGFAEDGLKGYRFLMSNLDTEPSEILVSLV